VQSLEKYSFFEFECMEEWSGKIAKNE